MKIAILGNGFDLCHGLKTTFVDFRNHLLDNNNASLVKRVDEIIKQQNPNFDYKDVLISWNDFERILGKHFKKNEKIRDQIILLEDLLEEFIENFFLYLQEVSKTKCNQIQSIKNELNNVDVVLTFNYTNTYEIYLQNRSIDLFHIHGSLEENFYPIIGYFYDHQDKYGSEDYSKRYNGNIIHKPAIAYKQNGLDLDLNISNFKKKYPNKIVEVVSIGYSYGESDMHVFDILNAILTKQSSDRNVRIDLSEKMQIIKYKIFSYEDEESRNIQEKIISTLSSKYNRITSVKVFGTGIKRLSKNTIEFDFLSY